MHEFHNIVEFSFNPRKDVFIVRFLDGTCLRVPIENLPPKYHVKSAEWEMAELAKNKEGLNVPTDKKRLNIPAHVLYAAGRIL